jgi:hypothetical protein
MTGETSGPVSSRVSGFELATAFLVGVIAIIVAGLIVLEVSTSHQGARADAAASRLASVAASRNNVSQAPFGFQISKTLEAAKLGMESTTRQLVALQSGDATLQAVGAADQVAYERLLAIAEEMGKTPDASSPLDPYARHGLASRAIDVAAMVAEQNHQADGAGAASNRGMTIVLGISIAALAGVLGGLAAVIGRGRPGAALLVLGYVAAGVALILAVIGAGRLALL